MFVYLRLQIGGSCFMTFVVLFLLQNPAQFALAGGAFQMGDQKVICFTCTWLLPVTTKLIIAYQFRTFLHVILMLSGGLLLMLNINGIALHGAGWLVALKAVSNAS